MKVAKWGNSLAVRLPAAMVKELGLQIGDDVDLLTAPNGSSRAVAERRSMNVVKGMSRREALAKLRKYRGLIPADFKFDREEANRRG